MADCTLLFVHGTGVRNQSYSRRLEQIRSKVAEFLPPLRVESCGWGETYGIDFEGLSLPNPPRRTEEEVAEAYRWEYLEVDPLFDLRLWCAPDRQSARRVLGAKPAAALLWEQSISRYPADYQNQVDLLAVLRQNQLQDLFLPAWNKVVQTGLPQQAFAAAGDEAASVAQVFAEALVAQMIHDAAALPEPLAVSPRTGAKIVRILLFGWNQRTKGLKDVFLRIFGSATRTVVRPLRAGASRAVAPAVGDILSYQAAGRDIRMLIRQKIETIQGSIIVLAHSLGGVACFELMVEARRVDPNDLSAVKGLITAGSQAPLLYELAALQTLKKGEPLPSGFPPWLNLYDENDLLSYRADRLFPVQADRQVDSMLPPLEAHSAYWTLDATWNVIADFVKQTHA
ncbi:MAG: hypothetical protein AB9869_10540 [Verrucomicrobiia bacterium]